MRAYLSVSAVPVLLFATLLARAEGSGTATVTQPTDADRSRPVAEIAGKPVSFGDLADTAHDSLEHQKAVYELQRRQLDEDYLRAQHDTLDSELNTLLNKRVLELEAKARKTTPLKVVGDVKTPPVSDQEVRALYDARKIEGSPEFEKIAPQLREALTKQKTEAALNQFYAQLRAKYKVSSQLEPLRAQVAADGPSRGAAEGAPVTIVEFADFECPFCRRMEASLQDVLKRYPNQVRLVFRQYPLIDIHPEALHAAQATVCADRQGKFWPMHDAIFADAAPLSLGSLRALSKQVGLDSEQFEECVREASINKVISDDVHAADELAVRATPTLFVNGRFLQGGVPEEQLTALIEDELKRAPKSVSTVLAGPSDGKSAR